jgi:hypothetical protein
MPEVIENDDGTVITKTDDGRFIVDSWGTAQVRDKEGQELPVSELISDVPNMMKYDPKITLGHTDTPLGKILDIQRSIKDTKKGKKDAIRIKYEIDKGRRYMEAARKGIEKGTYGAVSLKGFAYGKSTYKSDDDGVTEVPHDIEMVSFALCRSGMNPEATHIAINGKEIEKTDDGYLLEEPEFVDNVRKLMVDGLPYTKAMDTAKELYAGGIAKELVKADEAMLENENDNKVNKGDTPIQNMNNQPKGDDNMPEDELEGIKKELQELKEQNESLSKENDELKTKVEEMEKSDEDEPEEGDEVHKSDEPKYLTKEEVTSLLKEERESFVEEIKKDKDTFLEALGLNKVENSQSDPNLSGLLKKGEDGVSSIDTKKLYEMTKQGEEETYNSDLDSIPDIEKSIEEMFKGE